VNEKWRPNAVVFASLFRLPLVVFLYSFILIQIFPKLVFPQYHAFYFALPHLPHVTFGTFLRVRARVIESTFWKDQVDFSVRESERNEKI